MSADEVRTERAAASDATGPRHAAPRKPLFTRFHLPAGKAIAVAAMPTAVLMAMGMTPTLAVADDHAPSSTSKLADDYKDCVDALGKDGKDASATPSPSASPSETAQGTKDDATPSPSATGGSSGSSGTSSSSGSGSDDKGGATGSTPTAPASSAPKSGGSGASTPTPAPSPSATDKNLLDGIGDALGGLLGGGQKDTPSPSASATPSASPSPSASSAGTVKDTTDKVTGTVKDTTDKVTGTVKDTTDKATGTVKDTTDKVTGTVEDTTDAAGQAAGEATASPSASATPDDCKVATDAEGGVDNKVPVAEAPWRLEASSLLLKGADYQGVVEVRTSSGKTKKVLKYVISGGTDIGDLHQIVKDPGSSTTYHVQAAKGSTSTIRNGDTVMYTESISGNLFGLIPITFSPDSPPPLNIPLIYFTNVKVTQAAQFGGTLHVPGMHLYTD